MTPRPAEAMEFFAQVLGWTFYEMPPYGHGIQVGGRDIGGLFDIKGPSCPPDMSPVIGVMVKVENSDETVEKIRSLGGKAKPAFDVADQGEDGGLPRPQRRGLRYLGAEDDARHRRRQHSPRRPELVGDSDDGRGQGHGVLLSVCSDGPPR